MENIANNIYIVESISKKMLPKSACTTVCATNYLSVYVRASSLTEAIDKFNKVMPVIATRAREARDEYID